MQTITQALRPYLRHVAATADALDRARITDAAWGDLAGWQEQQAHDCAMLHARLAAKRHYAGLRAVTVPVYAPIARRPEPELAGMVSGILCRHLDHRPGDIREATPRRATAADVASMLVIFHYAVRL